MKASFGENPERPTTSKRHPRPGQRCTVRADLRQVQSPDTARAADPRRGEAGHGTADAHAANTVAVQRLLRAPATGANTYEAGVKAALDAMRQLNFGNAGDSDE
jgi:hypothetical protein